MRSIHLTRRQSAILLTAILVFLLSVITAEGYVLQHTNQTLSLPDNESFLNLTTAKNLAFSQTWGISRHEFAARSSSLLYPVLLAIGFFVFGAHVTVVLIINIVLGIGLLVLIQQWLIAVSIRPIQQLLILLAVILLTPLPLIVLAGREGILQLLLAVLFCTRLHKEWPQPTLSHRLYLYGALLVATQYTGIILIVIACGLLLRARRRDEAGELAFWSLVPVLAFGLLSLGKHGPFIPASMVPSTLSFLDFGWLIGILVAIAYPLTLLHNKSPSRQTSAIIIGSLITIFLLASTMRAYQNTTRACIDIYQQQWMEGIFARRYYNKWPMAVRDIGLVSYFTEASLLDLSTASLNQRTPSLQTLVREKHIKVAFIPHRSIRDLPEDWNKVASWQITATRGATNADLSFYAADTAVASELRKHLQDYQPSLPAHVAVRYY